MCTEIKYHQKFRGKIITIFNKQRSSSKKRGHPPPEYSKEDFIEYCKSSKKFNTLFRMWKLSGFNKWLAPSIDRLDNSKGYSFKNIRICTWFENDNSYNKSIKRTKNSKFINQICLKTGNVLNTFESFVSIDRHFGKKLKNISSVCNGLRNSAYGFTWSYV